jgi:hypothetical protein
MMAHHISSQRSTKVRNAVLLVIGGVNDVWFVADKISYGIVENLDFLLVLC